MGEFCGFVSNQRTVFRWWGNFLEMLVRQRRHEEGKKSPRRKKHRKEDTWGVSKKLHVMTWTRQRIREEKVDDEEAINQQRRFPAISTAKLVLVRKVVACPAVVNPVADLVPVNAPVRFPASERWCGARPLVRRSAVANSNPEPTTEEGFWKCTAIGRPPQRTDFFFSTNSTVRVFPHWQRSTAADCTWKHHQTSEYRSWRRTNFSNIRRGSTCSRRVDFEPLNYLHNQLLFNSSNHRESLISYTAINFRLSKRPIVCPGLLLYSKLKQIKPTHKDFILWSLHCESVQKLLAANKKICKITGLFKSQTTDTNVSWKSSKLG